MCMNDVMIFELRSPFALSVAVLIYLSMFGCVSMVQDGELTAAPLRLCTSLNGRWGCSTLHR